MFDFEFEIVFIGIRSKTDLLDDGFGGIGFDFLLLFPLVIQEFIEFDDPADRGIGIGGDHDQILTHLFSPIADGSCRVDAGLDFLAGYRTDFVEVVANQPDIGNPYVCVDFKLESGVVLP